VDNLVFNRLAHKNADRFLLPDYDSHRAKEVGEIIANQFAMMSHSADGHRIHATVSIGLATASSEMTSLTDLLAAADQALYQAKSQGGSQLVHHARGQERDEAARA
ncbi:MAG: diguanylate cyclase, partial [Burkholderia cenocepacia]